MNHQDTVGHPITNLLMQQAAAGDMSTADHIDQGAVVDLVDGARCPVATFELERGADLVKPAGVVTGHGTDQAPVDQVDPLNTLADLAREELPEPIAGRVVLVIEHLQRVEQKLDNLLVTLVRHLATARG